MRRSPRNVSLWSSHRIARYDTAATNSSETVYTFSLTFDCAHTVYAVPPTRTAQKAAISAIERFSVKCAQIRMTARNQNTAAAAETVALSRLVRVATSSPVHPVRSSHTFPSSTKKGFPGGCGIPMMCAVAMYSDVSQKAVEGPRVNT